MSKLKYIFGLPLYHENIDSKDYNKEEITSKIKENYNNSNIRNSWDNKDFFKSNIHHSNNDEKNNKFNVINYFNLEKIYEKVFFNFLKELGVYGKYVFNCKIVNYVCLKNNAFMQPHSHSECAYTFVHYLNFDPQEHIPTIFKSPYFFDGFLPFANGLRNVLPKESTANSWTRREWVLDTKEDDIVIFPGILEHYVRNLESNKLRITIAGNISFFNDNNK
jgi:hypothetical protein